MLFFSVYVITSLAKCKTTSFTLPSFYLFFVLPRDNRVWHFLIFDFAGIFISSMKRIFLWEIKSHYPDRLLLLQLFTLLSKWIYWCFLDFSAQACRLEMTNSLEGSELILDLNALFWDKCRDSKGVAYEVVVADSDSKARVYFSMCITSSICLNLPLLISLGPCTGPKVRV